MEYEYERGIIGMLGGIENRHLIDLSDHKQELKEVYRKAKAFDKIRNVDKDFYKEYGYYPNEEDTKGGNNLPTIKRKVEMNLPQLIEWG